jgi:hypothetical protein
MRYFLLIVCLSLLAASCKKPQKEEAPGEDFVKGEVLVGIDSTVQLPQLFTYVNAYGLSIAQVTGFHYTTTLSKSDIPYIKQVLNAKPYINTRGFSASVWEHYQTGIVHNTTMLWNMNGAHQQDYIQTLNTLRMTDDQSPTKGMMVKVPVGQEMYWKNRFARLSWVRWSDLNWISKFSLCGN